MARPRRETAAQLHGESESGEQGAAHAWPRGETAAQPARRIACAGAAAAATRAVHVCGMEPAA